MINTLLLVATLQQPVVVKKMLPTTYLRDTTKTYIIIHNDGNNLNAAATNLVLRLRKLSYHYFIAKNGTIYQFMDVRHVALHAGKSRWKTDYSLNSISVGICLQGSNDTKYTSAQYNSLSKIVRYLHKRFPDSKQRPVLTHAQVAIPRGRKKDPGKYFEIKRLKL